MGGLGGVEVEGRRAGRGERRRDLLRDEAGLAHAGDDDLPLAAEDPAHRRRRSGVERHAGRWRRPRWRGRCARSRRAPGRGGQAGPLARPRASFSTRPSVGGPFQRADIALSAPCGTARRCAKEPTSPLRRNDPMQFFIDTADVGEIKKALALGLCDGVTTNPSLVAKTGPLLRRRAARDRRPRPRADLGRGHGDRTAEGMLAGGPRTTRSSAPNVVIKVPLIVEGLKAVKVLTAGGDQAPTSPSASRPVQALLAAKAGATYVSPFVGRLDDVSEDGMAAHRADRRDLPELRLRDEGARRLGAPPASTCSRRRARGRRGHHPVLRASTSWRSTRSPTSA